MNEEGKTVNVLMAVNREARPYLENIMKSITTEAEKEGVRSRRQE